MQQNVSDKTRNDKKNDIIVWIIRVEKPEESQFLNSQQPKKAICKGNGREMLQWMAQMGRLQHYRSDTSFTYKERHTFEQCCKSTVSLLWVLDAHAGRCH